jgi:HEAT repeat protein
MNFEAIYRLFYILKNSEDYRVRNSAIQEIMSISDNSFIEFVVYALDFEKDEEILAYLAEMTVRKGVKDRAILILPLINSHFPLLRCHICGLLGNCEDDRVVDKLIDKLRNDEDVNVRSVAAHSLGRIGGHKAIEALIWSKDNDFVKDKDGWGVNVIAENSIAEIKKRNGIND